MFLLTAGGECAGLVSGPMSSKYYAHFTAPGAAFHASGPEENGEWCGVVELTTPLKEARERHQLALVLACNLDLELEEVRVLGWCRLH